MQQLETTLDAYDRYVAILEQNLAASLAGLSAADVRAMLALSQSHAVAADEPVRHVRSALSHLLGSLAA